MPRQRYRDVTNEVLYQPIPDAEFNEWIQLEEEAIRLYDKKQEILEAYHSGESWEEIATIAGVELKRVKIFIDACIGEEKIQQETVSGHPRRSVRAIIERHSKF